MKKRTAKQFSRNEVGEVARIYANPKNNYTYRELMQLLNTNKSTVFRLLDRAVEEHIVDDETVHLMEEKAKFNVERLHEGKGNRRTEVHYNVLRAKREKFMIGKIAAIQLITEYAESNQTRQEFCKEKGISRELFNKIMLEYIVTENISDEIFEKLAEKGMKNNFSEPAKRFWQTIIEKRKSNLSRG